MNIKVYKKLHSKILAPKKAGQRGRCPNYIFNAQISYHLLNVLDNY